MTTEIKIRQTFDITVDNEDSDRFLFQNYYVDGFGGIAFAPFQVQGSVSALGGDNSQIQVLFPTTKEAVQIVDKGNGNRKSQLILTTHYITEEEQVGGQLSQEIYVGIGASFSEDTIELRFNTAVDAVASNFPAQRLNEDNVGILPLDSSLSLR